MSCSYGIRIGVDCTPSVIYGGFFLSQKITLLRTPGFLIEVLWKCGRVHMFIGFLFLSCRRFGYQELTDPRMGSNEKLDLETRRVVQGSRLEGSDRCVRVTGAGIRLTPTELIVPRSTRVDWSPVSSSTSECDGVSRLVASMGLSTSRRYIPNL